MSLRFSPTSSLTNIYLTSDSPMLNSPLPYIPSQATVELLPSLPAFTTTSPTFVGPNMMVPSYTMIQPQFPLAPGLDLDNDERSKNIITEYFYYKTLDKWLYGDMVKLLGYLKVSGNNVDFINNINDYNPRSVDKDTQEIVEIKIKFIEQNVLTKNDMYNILREYAREMQTKWADMVNKNNAGIKMLVSAKLKEKFIRSIKKKIKS